MSERNKQKVKLFIEAVWNEGRLELIDELVAADYLGQAPCLHERVVGPDGVRQLVSSGRRSHPGLYIKIEDQIAEDDRVVTRWEAWSRTPEAHGDANAVDGRQCCQGVSIVRLLAGKQVDSHTQYTNLDLDRGEPIDNSRAHTRRLVEKHG